VLVAACGPGDAGPPVAGAERVAAFDVSRRFARACRLRHPGWHVTRADLLRIPHADRAFDVSVLYSTLHHFPPGARAALAELARVTRGRIVILEGVVPERGWLRAALLLWYRLVDGGHHYYTTDELLGAIRGLGLHVASSRRCGPIGHLWLAELVREGDSDGTLGGSGARAAACCGGRGEAGGVPA
jgi:SAM-dependent methyltransferase